MVTPIPESTTPVPDGTSRPALRALPTRELLCYRETLLCAARSHVRAGTSDALFEHLCADVEQQLARVSLELHRRLGPLAHV